LLGEILNSKHKSKRRSGIATTTILGRPLSRGLGAFQTQQGPRNPVAQALADLGGQAVSNSYRTWWQKLPKNILGVTKQLGIFLR
jgi:hypothetical protein